MKKSSWEKAMPFNWLAYLFPQLLVPTQFLLTVHKDLKQIMMPGFDYET